MGGGDFGGARGAGGNGFRRETGTEAVWTVCSMARSACLEISAQNKVQI